MGLTSLPTLAAVTAGSAMLNAEVDGREPFLADGIDPLVAIVPRVPYAPAGPPVPPSATTKERRWTELRRSEMRRAGGRRAGVKRASSQPAKTGSAVRARPPEVAPAWPGRRPCPADPPFNVRRVRWPDASARPPLFHQGLRSRGAVKLPPTRRCR